MNPETIFQQAIVLHQQGRLPQAEALYRRLLKKTPAHADGLHLLGVLCAQTGRHREAADFIRRAIRLAPEVSEYHSNLGLALHQQGEHEAAIGSFHRALDLKPGDPQALFHLGNACLHTGQLEQAVEIYREILERVPGHLPALNNLGNVMRKLGQFDNATAIFRKLLAMRPDFAEGWYNLGMAHRDAENHAEAVDTFQKAIELKPDNAEGWNSLGIAYTKLDRYPEALDAYTRALAIRPDFIHALFNQATALQALGRFDEGIKVLERVLALMPNHTEAFLQLALARKCDSVDHPHIQNAEKLLLCGGLEDKPRAELHFALGKLYDDCREYEAAFAHFREGNALVRRTYSYDPAELARLVDRLISVFTRGFFTAREHYGADTDQPVFIFGMPRSGTTLVEQILASHPGVHGAGELKYFNEAVSRPRHGLWTPETYPERLLELSASNLRPLGEAYLQRLRRDAATTPRITDKMPQNFLCLGLIALLFPRAHYIHCRRDPRATCLSIYFSYFAGVHPYAYDLLELGRYYRQYLRLMEHWRVVLPVNILDIEYEKLVSHPETESRRLIAHVGLPWDDRCLAFAETDRPVRTHSLWQVRQSIYTDSLEKWRNYERHLQPLLEALEI